MYYFWLSLLPALFLGRLNRLECLSRHCRSPARRAEQAEIEAQINAPVSVEDIRWACESPAETAFLDAMVSAYDLQTGPGAIEGRGLRLRNQISMGRLRIHRNHASSQYRADFLVDEKLVVEIDGATYHSSPEAIARDQQRDVDIRREGYTVLRIPAQVVFQNSVETVKRVEAARTAIR